MKIYKYIHSCILLEEGNTKVLFDPGYMSFVEGAVKPEDFTGISAVVITHEHRDHMDISALKVLCYRNKAPVLTNNSVAALLAKEGIDAVVMKDSGYCAGDITLKAITAEHEKNFLLKSPPNNAYIANDIFLHPGDSLDTALYAYKNIKVLALPAAASWANHMQIVKFALAISPKTIVPIHDGFIKDFYLEAKNNQYQKFFSKHNITFHPLGVGKSIEL
jgi:L-ascorbate metabolism protein UlaG (beta-lactamase superfamily)